MHIVIVSVQTSCTWPSPGDSQYSARTLFPGHCTDAYTDDCELFKSIKDCKTGCRTRKITASDAADKTFDSSPRVHGNCEENMDQGLHASGDRVCVHR